MRKALNPRQEKFCQEYVKSGNATAAMLEAYPSRRGWTEEAQNVAASRLANNAKILVRIEKLRQEAKEASDVSRDEVLGILAKVIRGEPVTDSEQTTASGKSSRTVSVSWAIERLCKMCGFDNPQKLEVTGKDGAALHPDPLIVEIIDSREQVEKGEEE